MNNSKSNLTKSKSSNGETAKKLPTRRSNKKSRSNAEIKPFQLKKRGMYVEKRPTKISLNGSPEAAVNRLKCTSRIVNNNRITSVLKIDSKNLIGTQCPDYDDSTSNRVKYKPKKITQDILDDVTTSKQKPKYKSRVLSKLQHDMDDIVVLQSRKEICGTPSIYSERSFNEPKARRSRLPPNLVSELDSEVEDENLFKITEHPESMTLVNDNPNKDDKKIYDFFVDLLETTFNVCKSKASYNAHAEEHVASAYSSKVNLTIDENIAKKLNMGKVNKLNNTACQRNKSNVLWPDNKRNLEVQLEDHSYSAVKTINMSNFQRKLKSKSSASNNYNCKLTAPRTFYQRQTLKAKVSKKDRRKHLLNLLRDELRMDYDKNMEPRNFFQALKVMANNKKRIQAPARVKVSAKKVNEDENGQCRFKRRTLLSRKNKKSYLKKLKS